MGLCLCRQRSYGARRALDIFEESQQNYNEWLESRRVVLPDEFIQLEPFLELGVAEFLREQLLQGSAWHLQYVVNLFQHAVDALDAHEDAHLFNR